MLRRSLPLSVMLAGCSDSFAAGQDIEEAPYLSVGTSQSPGPATTDADMGTSTSTGTTSETTGGTPTTSSASSPTSGEDSSSGEAPLPPPAILAVDLAELVHAAGLVPITVMVEQATLVRIEVDKGASVPLVLTEPDIFTGSIPIRGAIDNYPHEVKITAARGDLETSTTRTLNVEAPPAGTVANTVLGPLGSQTSRLALTPEDDVLEVGSLEIAGVKRPAIRKLSGITGGEMWPATRVLDTREGQIADVAVTPDGGLWVAMNVRDAGVWRPRLALYDAEASSVEADFESAPGHTVNAIAADAEGGCLAVGFAAVEDDQDVWLRRIDGAHVPTLDATWDYLADPMKYPPHSFVDLGFSVEIEDDVAWIAGASFGVHNLIVPQEHSRGLILRVNLHTGAELGPAIIAMPADGWPSSMFLGSALHPSGLLVVGNASTTGGGNQRMETALYDRLTGERSWFAAEPQAVTAVGQDVAFDSQGRAISGGAIQDGSTLRGVVIARRVGENAAPLFSHWLPKDSEASLIYGVVADRVDRIRAGGHTTTDKQTTTRVVFVHP